MNEDYWDDTEICHNCGSVIHTDEERYFSYEDRKGVWIVLCEDCMDECIHN